MSAVQALGQAIGLRGVNMTTQQITDAITAFLANGGAVQHGPTLYADGCNGEDDMSEESDQ